MFSSQSILLKLVFVCLIFPVFAQAQPKTPKVLFVIADGIPADVIEKLETPGIHAITKKGAYKRAFVGGYEGTYTQTPTISAPGYNNLLTGTWGYKHNVWDNNIKAPNYHYWSIFRFLKEQHPQKTTAIFSSWLDNRTKLAGDGLPETGNQVIDYHFDGFELDTIQFPHDSKRLFMHRIDEMVVHKADSVIRASAPDLSWVYLEYTDDMGHMYGDSEPFYQAIGYLDVQMEKLHKAIQYREEKFNEDWLIILTTDHGRDAATGKDHGGQSSRERTTWIATNAKQLNPYFQSSQPAIVDILPTMAEHLRIALPQAQKRELDGVSLIGPVSIAEPRVHIADDSLVINWKAFATNEKVKVWLATTNHFKTGTPDQYKLLGEASASVGTFIMPIKEHTDFYKVVIEGKYNSINAWAIVK